jgi:hypothetical protein
MLPDRTLRRAVIDLAHMPETDRGAILDMLEPQRRGRVLELLAEYAGVARQPGRPVRDEPDLGRLSPWLADRIRTGDSMTGEAADLLCRCAAEVLPPRQLRVRGLLARLGAAKGGRA